MEMTARTIDAVFYNGENDSTALVPVTIGSKESIESYLVSSDGKALSVKIGNIDYWVLRSNVNRNFLLFRWHFENRFDSAIEEDVTKAMFLTLE